MSDWCMLKQRFWFLNQIKCRLYLGGAVESPVASAELRQPKTSIPSKAPALVKSSRQQDVAVIMYGACQYTQTSQPNSDSSCVLFKETEAVERVQRMGWDP